MTGVQRIVNGSVVEQWDDSTRTYTDFRPEPDFTRPYTAAENLEADRRIAEATSSANESDLTAKAQAAVSGNNTYLGLTSPTNAQVAAQVKALTRQSNALIKLEVRDFLTTDGT